MLMREEILRKEVVYKLNSMEMINILRNIECWICENKKTFIDLYSSKNSKGKSPVVVLIHGEAKDVNFKESGQYTSLAKLVASVGLRAVTFNHKVLSDGFAIEEVNSDINNLTVDVYNHPTGNHAFDLFDDNDRSREIIDETLDFFKKHLEQV